jgi:hypothetical protein
MIRPGYYEGSPFFLISFISFFFFSHRLNFSFQKLSFIPPHQCPRRCQWISSSWIA